MNLLTLLALCQLTPGAPDERTWPLAGALARPDGTELRIHAARVERRWNPAGGRFLEELSAESRCAARAVVERKAFTARLRKGPPGVYRVAVREEEKDALVERLVLGGPGDLPASWSSAPEKLSASVERLQELLRTARKVAQGETAAAPELEKSFRKSLLSEERVLAELALRSDFTATAALLGRICALLRNAQIWGARPADDGNGAFLEADVSFDGLDRTLASAPAVLKSELKASVASLLALLAARAAEKPAKLLPALHEAARKAVGPLDGAAPDFVALVESASRADVDELPELRKRLETVRDELVEPAPDGSTR